MILFLTWLCVLLILLKVQVYSQVGLEGLEGVGEVINEEIFCGLDVAVIFILGVSDFIKSDNNPGLLDCNPSDAVVCDDDCAVLVLPLFLEEHLDSNALALEEFEKLKYIKNIDCFASDLEKVYWEELSIGIDEECSAGV
jgi:hypothetical protein